MCRALETKCGAAGGAVRRHQSRAELLGLASKTAHPELAPLVGHARQHSCDGGGVQSAASEQPGDQETARSPRS